MEVKPIIRHSDNEKICWFFLKKIEKENEETIC